MWLLLYIHSFFVFGFCSIQSFFLRFLLTLTVHATLHDNGTVIYIYIGLQTDHKRIKR